MVYRARALNCVMRTTQPTTERIVRRAARAAALLVFAMALPVGVGAYEVLVLDLPTPEAYRAA